MKSRHKEIRFLIECAQSVIYVSIANNVFLTSEDHEKLRFPGFITLPRPFQSKSDRE